MSESQEEEIPAPQRLRRGAVVPLIYVQGFRGRGGREGMLVSDLDLRSSPDSIQIVIPENRGILNYIHNKIIHRLRIRRLGLILTENIYERLSSVNASYLLYKSAVDHSINDVKDYFIHKMDNYMAGELGDNDDVFKKYLLYMDLESLCNWYKCFLLNEISQEMFVSFFNEILPLDSSS